MTERSTTPRGDERCFDLKPDAKGFAYVLMWMDHLLEHDQDADPSYVLEWRVFVEACRSAMLSETALTDEKGRPMTYWGGAASPDKKDDAWRSAALRLGEQLAPTGPNWYYAMTPTQWLEWCQSALPSAVAPRTLSVGDLPGLTAFIEWNRSQGKPLVEICFEAHVYEQALRFRGESEMPSATARSDDERDARRYRHLREQDDFTYWLLDELQRSGYHELSMWQDHLDQAIDRDIAQRATDSRSVKE